MIDRTTVEAVFLDHNYCAPINFEKEITSKPKPTSNMTDNGETLSWEDDIGVEFEPPSSQRLQESSSLSPSHSVDSGFDNEMNLFGDFNLDLDDLETYLLGEDTNVNLTNQKLKTLPTKQNPSTSTSTSTSTTTNTKRSSTTTKQKTMEDPMDDLEKSKKNAIAARENRQKKKKHMEAIEKEIKELRKENEALKAKDRNHSQTVEKLENEVTYFRNVIANQSTLSALVKSLVSTQGITFSSSLVSQEPEQESTPSVDDDNDADDDGRRYNTRGGNRKRSSDAATPSCSTKKPRKDIKGGVCLHISQDKVSLELCNQCSIKAHGSGNE